MDVVLKASLSHEQQLRTLNAAALDFYLIKQAAPVAKKAKQAGIDYNEAVKRDGKNHNYGSPHAGIAVAALQALAEQVEGKDREVLQQTVQYAQTYKQMAFTDLIPHFQLKEIHNPKENNKQEQMAKATEGQGGG